MKTLPVFQAFRDTFSGPSSYLPSICTEQTLGLMRFNTPATNSNTLTPRMPWISQETTAGLHTASFHFSRETAASSGVHVWDSSMNTAHGPANHRTEVPWMSSLTLQGSISDLLLGANVAEPLFSLQVKSSSYSHQPLDIGLLLPSHICFSEYLFHSVFSEQKIIY